MSDIKITKGYIPGSIGRIVELHGTYYHEHWGFGLFFETKVATGLAEFLNCYDEKRDGFWIVLKNGRVEGSIAIDGIHANDKGAHLRWFIMSDALRGQGIGRKLINIVIDFCRNKGYRRIYLWTFEGLNSAIHLYETIGFGLTESHKGKQWGTEVTEQKFELEF
jgi:GNAT superfamily N-acetyltransferase